MCEFQVGDRVKLNQKVIMEDIHINKNTCSESLVKYFGHTLIITDKIACDLFKLNISDNLFIHKDGIILANEFDEKEYKAMLINN